MNCLRAYLIATAITDGTPEKTNIPHGNLSTNFYRNRSQQFFASEKNTSLLGLRKKFQIGVPFTATSVSCNTRISMWVITPEDEPVYNTMTLVVACIKA